MARALSDDELLKISKDAAQTINAYRIGVQITSSSGLNIEQLRELACKDRFEFAEQILIAAKWAIRRRSPLFRLALARSYYSMYHTARSVVYFTKGGDDHESHSELPKHIPKDFPDRDKWENEIKTARLERNRADYDPYPKAEKSYKIAAQSTLKCAEEFIPIARTYLRRKGCSV